MNSPAPITLDQLHDAFLSGRAQTTRRAYAADLRDFTAFAGAADPPRAIGRLLDLDAAGARLLTMQYRDYLVSARRLTAATVNRRLATLRSIVRLARQLGMVGWGLDVEGLRSTPYRDTRGPGLEAWRKLREHATRAAIGGNATAVRNLALLRLLHDLGLRRGEVCSLDVASVDLEGGILHVVGKGKREPARLSLPGPVRAILGTWLGIRGSKPGPLFPGARGRPRLTGDGVAQIVAAAGDRAGLTVPVRPHGLRHQAITRALDLTNGDVRKVQRFSRHAKVETLLRYDDARRDEAGEIAGRLGDDG